MTTQSKRRYEKRRRAASEAETKQRITEAAMELHGTIGPARTTIKGVAEKAGVQRATVYRHFPDEEAIFAACSAHWYALNPPPDAGEWPAVADPDERLRLALSRLYRWYGQVEPMLANIVRDRELVPAMASARAATEARFEGYLRILMQGRGLRGGRRRRAAASIAHALGFQAWRSLTRENDLTDAEAIELMAAMVAAAGR
jgi:AcrR family transcriptional regulator